MKHRYLFVPGLLSDGEGSLSRQSPRSHGGAGLGLSRGQAWGTTWPFETQKGHHQTHQIRVHRRAGKAPMTIYQQSCASTSLAIYTIYILIVL